MTEEQQDLLDSILAVDHRLSDRERQFIDSISSARGENAGNLESGNGTALG